MTDKTFNVAGIVTHLNATKVRFANDMVRRVKQFTKGGAERVDLIELPSEMDKIAALKYLQTHELFQSPEDQAIINDALSDRESTSKPKEVKVKVAKTKAKPSLDSIKARAKQKAEEEALAQEIAEVASTEVNSAEAESVEAEPEQ